jgi:AcrR family transcriptional regulator
MRTHGWQGEPPATDEEAVQRILAATHRCIQQHGARMTIVHVATELGVSRATVYRYFPTTATLLRIAITEGTRTFRDDLGRRLQALDDPAEAIIEGIVQTVTQAPDDPYLQLLLHEPTHTLLRNITSDAAREIVRSDLLANTSINWAQKTLAPSTFNEMVEWSLRVIQSFLSDPGEPLRPREELREYLRRWLTPAIREWATTPVAH